MIVFIVVIVSLTLLAGILYFLFPPVLVIGDSMFPTYRDQEVVFGRRIFLKSKLKPGDVVVYRSPDEPTRVVIKRIEMTTNNWLDKKFFYCLGDNSGCSHDSRDYGFVPSKNLVCKVIKPRENLNKGGKSNDEQ